MKQSTNNAYIDGVLNEIDLRTGEKDGRKYVAGKVTLLVEQVVGDRGEIEEIPVSVFAYDKTSKGTDNPGYKQLMGVMETGVSVSACGNEEEADKYSVGGGSISLNKFAKEGKLISFPQVRGSFFNKITRQFQPRATFEQTVLVKEIKDEVVNDEVTGRLILSAVLVQYNGTPDIIDYIVESPNAIDYVKNYYNKGDTIKISGVIRYSVTVEKRMPTEAVGFGEPEAREFKKTVREFIITSGSANALSGDAAFDKDEVVAALAKEKARTDALIAAENGSEPKSADRGF